MELPRPPGTQSCKHACLVRSHQVKFANPFSIETCAWPIIQVLYKPEEQGVLSADDAAAELAPALQPPLKLWGPAVASGGHPRHASMQEQVHGPPWSPGASGAGAGLPALPGDRWLRAGNSTSSQWCTFSTNGPLAQRSCECTQPLHLMPMMSHVSCIKSQI